MKRHYPSLLCLLVLLAACSGEKKQVESNENVAELEQQEKNEVTVQTLKRQNFDHELVSNGKVSAKMIADLNFETTGVVTAIYVKNGDYVRKGQKIAELDRFKLKNKLEQAQASLENSKLELQDVLIGQGYAVNDTSNVPRETMKLARVKSGYDQNLSQYELAKYEDASAVLAAPFDGIIANLSTKPYNTATPSAEKPFCTVIGAQGMEVTFNVLENELALIRMGDKVVVAPYADTSARQEGSISGINPYVDEKGMVEVKATVAGSSKLFTGMNVRVNVRRSLGEQLVIPKSAVVLRSGKQVVFTLKDGKAQWNYIQTGLENMESYSVVDGLNEGDEVIVTGNVNLAHETPVTVTEQQ